MTAMQHRTRLYTKFILSFLIFGIAGFITIATLSTALTNKYLIESRSRTLYDEASLIASTYSTVYEGGDVQVAQTYPQIKAIATFLNSYIFIVNRDGKIVADSQNQHTGTVIEDFDPAMSGRQFYMTGTFYGLFPGEVLSVSAPIVSDYQTYGYVMIHLPMEVVMESQYRILNIVYITSAIVFLLSLLILVVFHIVVYRPLKKITEGASQYAQGNMKYKVELKSHDEMAYLAATLNYMSDEMDKSEEYQKSFIANISHDFRSPLTSIRGYLEAMKDGTIPPEMMDKYLGIVIDETNRLTKLTENLLTLNTIDAKGQLSRTDFDINQVIKDTASSFRGQCMSKNITFDLTFDDDTAMVYADLGKIQQVLYNLIDNAVKFSHNDSVIYIKTEHQRGKLYVSVRDTGTGIAKKDIGKVFDRFYKSDSSRGKDKKGTGLGLSIVKEIINAHQEIIDVVSTEGVGTEFIFTLTQAEEPAE